MRELGIFADVQAEIGQVIVGQVDRSRIAELVADDRTAVEALIRPADRPSGAVPVRAGS
jgi:hypothetical protein